MESKICLNCGLPFVPGNLLANFRRAKFCGRPCYSYYRRRDDLRQAMFWKSVDKNCPGGCWLWTGWKLNSGYGETTVRSRKITVHRLSYIIANGPIPAGKLVMHTCDVPICVNPAHLRLGTDADNQADKKAKNRHTRGELTRRNKLVEEQVRKILPLKGIISSCKLAALYKVRPGAITAIWRRQTWKHVL